MKKFIITIFTLLPFFLVSQEVDQTFLDSLPEEVREDVIKSMLEKEDKEEPIYRNRSTMVDKEFEEYEQEYEKEEDEDDSSKLFGEDFFDSFQSSFMPINEPNLDGSYVLDFGDELEIQLIGQNDLIDTFAIKRDGSISIPDIGKLNLSGLSLNEASDLIKAKVKNTFIGTEAYISLTNIRDIRVLVAGNAFNPGIYTLNGNSNILHALSMAGGINEIGSYRNISLVRRDEVIENLDIYDVLISGKSTFAKSLRSGDSVVVRSVGKIVAIESGVLRPGRYEMKDNESLNDLIDFANNFNLKADKKNILLKRIDGGVSKVINLDLKDLDSYIVKNGDTLFIREFKFNTIKIAGAVKNPGTYLLPLGTTLSQLIIDAGGYEPSAYPFGGYLNSQKSLEINEKAKDKLYEKFLNNLIRNSVTRSSQDSNSLSLILKQLKNAQVTGRVIAEFDLDIINANSELDTILEDEDEILIPNITQQVYVQGDVNNPGAIRYSSGKDINYYINKSGGALDTADIKTLFVVHPNGETQSLSNIRSRLSFINSKDELIYPGSIIYIPKSSNLSSNIEIASIVAPILSSVALSITSLSVLNNNN